MNRWQERDCTIHEDICRRHAAGELGKNLTYVMMGRSGFEDYRQKVVELQGK